MPAPTAPGTARHQPCPNQPRPAPAPPQRASLDLGAVLTAPGCARAWTRQVLWEWGLAALADAAEAVVSELVANAVNASRAAGLTAVWLTLTVDRGRLAIRVRDFHPCAPQARTPGADDEDGRGLLLVAALSDQCGWYPLGGSGPGKVTWAVLAAAGAAS